MIFNDSIYYEKLPASDLELKAFLNYNPIHNAYTRKQNIPGRNPGETDRGGWRGYDRVYSKYFKKIRTKELNVLEIGIKEGYGIYAWQRYFTNSKIYGIDNDWNNGIIYLRNELRDKHALFKLAKLYNIDSTKEDNWLEFYGKSFDIIIEDGNHHPTAQLETFKCGWKYLKSGGLYFIEDVGHRYDDEKLKDLSDYLVSKSNEFKEMKIYHHDNVGLKHLLADKKFVKSRNIKGDASTIEYVIAIKKK
jgi:hypothetical protein